MTRITRAATGTALLTAALIAIASPAHAEPYVPGSSIPVNGYEWEVITDTFGIQEATWNESEVISYGDAFDDMHSFGTFDDLALDGNGYTGFVCANADITGGTDEQPDVTVTCDEMTDALGLTLDGEIMVYAEGDLARQLVTVSNDTGAAIDFSWEFYANYGETSGRATSTTPTVGENLYTDADLWSYNEHGYDGLNAAIAWGVPGAPALHENVGDDALDDLYVWNDADDDGTQLTLAAGESLTLAFYFKLDAAGSINPVVPSGDLAPAVATTDPAVVMAEFASFDGRLTRGLANGLVVGNWGTVAGGAAAPEGPELAQTGTSPQVIALGIGAVLALALGAGLVLARTLRAATRPTR